MLFLLMRMQEQWRNRAKTHEFQALATSGEDQLVVCRKEKLAMNLEMASTQRQKHSPLYLKNEVEVF